MTAIRQAFARSIVTMKGFNSPFHHMVFEALKRAPKPSRDSQRGWSTNITFRTYNALKNQGVLV